MGWIFCQVFFLHFLWTECLLSSSLMWNKEILWGFSMTIIDILQFVLSCGLWFPVIHNDYVFVLKELDKSAQDLVDFSPVYKCLYIFTVVVSQFVYFFNVQNYWQRFFQDSVQAARTENNDLTKTYVYGVLKLK